MLLKAGWMEKCTWAFWINTCCHLPESSQHGHLWTDWWRHPHSYLVVVDIDWPGVVWLKWCHRVTKNGFQISKRFQGETWGCYRLPYIGWSRLSGWVAVEQVTLACDYMEPRRVCEEEGLWLVAAENEEVSAVIREQERESAGSGGKATELESQQPGWSLFRLVLA